MTDEILKYSSWGGLNPEPSARVHISLEPRSDQHELTHWSRGLLSAPPQAQETTLGVSFWGHDNRMPSPFLSLPGVQKRETQIFSITQLLC